MKNFRLLIGAALIAFISGCAAPKHNYQPVTINISEPPIGSVNVKQVGDEMLRQGKYREHDALYVKTELKPTWAYTVYPGYFLKTGEDEAGEYYRIGGAGEESGYIDKAMIADPYQGLMVKRDSNTLCVVTAFNIAVCSNEVKNGFEQAKRPVVSRDTLQRTLLYSGKTGNKINIGYREFAGDIARPAFSNSVEYDLSESTKIGYKGALLEIIEATNTFIKYKLLSNFNNANR